MNITIPIWIVLVSSVAVAVAITVAHFRGKSGNSAVDIPLVNNTLTLIALAYNKLEGEREEWQEERERLMAQACVSSGQCKRTPEEYQDILFKKMLDRENERHAEECAPAVTETCEPKDNACGEEKPNILETAIKHLLEGGRIEEHEARHVTLICNGDGTAWLMNKLTNKYYERLYLGNTQAVTDTCEPKENACGEDVDNKILYSCNSCHGSERCIDKQFMERPELDCCTFWKDENDIMPFNIDDVQKAVTDTCEPKENACGEEDENSDIQCFHCGKQLTCKDKSANIESGENSCDRYRNETAQAVTDTNVEAAESVKGDCEQTIGVYDIHGNFTSSPQDENHRIAQEKIDKRTARTKEACQESIGMTQEERDAVNGKPE